MNEDQSIALLYGTYKNDVFNLALHYLQNVEEAEEAMQDVFFKIYKNWGNFEKKAEIKTWVYRITINTCLDYLKARKRKKRFSFLSFFSDSNTQTLYQISDFNHPGVILENREQTGYIFMLINQLPDNQKTALILARIENKSQIEIAEIMQISTKAVESLLQRAKKTLAKQLKLS